MKIKFDKKEYTGRPHFPVSIGVSVSGGQSGSDLTYKWTFGRTDKFNPKFHHPVDGPSVTHTFPDEADDYKAKVVVTDENGVSATAIATVKVCSLPLVPLYFLFYLCASLFYSNLGCITIVERG